MKQNKRHRTSFINTIIVIVTVVALVFLSIALYNSDKLQVRFETIVLFLSRIENAIVSLDSKVGIVVCVFALFLAKTQLPIPMSFLCVISGMVFPLPQAIVMNVVFTCIVHAVKYWEGLWIGGGWARKIINIKQIKFIREWIEFKGNGNPYILFVCRLIPSIPLGMVSKLYGSLHYDFLYYLVLSTLGFLPRIYVYTSIGGELFNPFSVKFILLIMATVVFTGTGALVLNLIYGKKYKQMTQTLLIYSQKEKYKIVF